MFLPLEHLVTSQNVVASATGLQAPSLFNENRESAASLRETMPTESLPLQQPRTLRGVDAIPSSWIIWYTNLALGEVSSAQRAAIHFPRIRPGEVLLPLPRAILLTNCGVC